MQSLETVAFSVELFVVIFSLFCWFITPANIEKFAVDTKKEDIKPETETQQAKNNSHHQTKTRHEHIDANSIKELSILDRLNDLEIGEVRNIASLLQGQNILPHDISFTGKGKTKVWIIKKIENILFSHQQDVEQALSLVLQDEVF